MRLYRIRVDHRRRQWHPTPVLLPGKSYRRRSLVGCSPWGREESDTTKRLHFDFLLSCIGEGNGNPWQCSCLENPRDGGAWWAAVYGVAPSRTRLKRLSSSSSSSRVDHKFKENFLVVVQSLSQAQHFETPQSVACQASLSFTISQSLAKWYLCFLIHCLVCHSFSFKEQGLLILWLQSPSAVILEPKKIKSVTVSTFPPSICHEVMGLNAMISVFLNVEL